MTNEPMLFSDRIWRAIRLAPAGLMLLAACGGNTDESQPPDPGGTIYARVVLGATAENFAELRAIDPQSGAWRPVPSVTIDPYFISAASPEPVVWFSDFRMFRLDLRSGESTPFWPSDFTTIDPVPSPSGGEVVFQSGGEGPGWVVRIGDVGTGAVRVVDSLAHPGDIQSIRWLNDSVLVYLRPEEPVGNRPWRIGTDGSGREPLPVATTSAVLALEPSRDGRRLALSRDATSPDTTDVTIVDLATGDERLLARVPGTVWMAWSPRDDYLAIQFPRPDGSADVLLVEVATGRQRVLDVSEGLVGPLAWAVDP